MTDHRKEFDEGRIASTCGGVPKNFGSPAPDPSVKENGQHPCYWILSESERAKGFVRPVRESYRHVGILGPKFPLRDATPEEIEQFKDEGWVRFEEYPEGSNGLGCWWSQKELDSVGKGCGVVTTMSRSIAESYARDPHFYGSTMCCGCRTHLPVGADGEFVWEGTNERVGT